MSFELIVYQLLKRCSIPVSKPYLFERIRAHPDYPSLASFTDLLDEWQLEYAALQIEEKDLPQMEYPFLAHIVTHQGMEDFLIVESPEQVEKDKDRFLHSWTGIVVWIAGNAEIDSEEHAQSLMKERLNRKARWVTGLALLASLIYTFSSGFDLIGVIYGLLTLAGLAVSAAIVGYASGIDNVLSKSFCKVGSSGCQSIIQSDLSKLLPNLHLSDLALIYFTGLFISLVFSWPFGMASVSQWLIIPSGLAVITTMFTLGYQLVKNRWCKLCLILSAIIWAQAALLVIFTPAPLTFSLNQQVLPTITLAFVLSTGWVLMKPYFLNSRKVDEQLITIRKWRQYPHWFHAILPLHKAIDRAIWDREVFYGNPNGVLQITLATAPFCGPCGRAHAQLEHIFSRYPDDIGIKIRFVIKETNEKDREACLSILQTYKHALWKNTDGQDYLTNELGQQIIEAWFKQQNLKAFQACYPNNQKDTNELLPLLRQHIQWGEQFEIEQTPGFFINGYEMPNPHTLTDLNIFLDDYMQLLKPTDPAFTPLQQSNQPKS
jgi:hypothetical protein